MTNGSQALVFYTRHNCSLCEAARKELVGGGYVFREIYISGDRGLESEFGNMVPVLEANGEIVFSAGMNPAQIPELLSELTSD